jgi:hypothetical protein
MVRLLVPRSEAHRWPAGPTRYNSMSLVSLKLNAFNKSEQPASAFAVLRERHLSVVPKRSGDLTATRTGSEDIPAGISKLSSVQAVTTHEGAIL